MMNEEILGYYKKATGGRNTAKTRDITIKK
jgi:hypothetical protein